MNARSRKPEVGTRKPVRVFGLATRGLPLFLVVWCAAAFGDDLTVRVQERTAIERVYYSHRLGTKSPFEQVAPSSLIKRLVQEDLRKEAVLRKVYGIEIADALLEAEVRRINATTRAPAMLAEIKAALDNDAVKFANAFAKPFLVERLLRNKFENDDALHADRRHEVEQVRARLLSVRSSRREEAQTSKPEFLASELIGLLQDGHSNEVSESTWQLTPRPTEATTPSADELEIKKRFGPDAQILLSPRGTDRERKFYFEDLPPPLRNILAAQLRQPGDVSAVIETPGGFLLYICKERTGETLNVAVLSLPKRNYEQWLNEQAGGVK